MSEVASSSLMSMCNARRRRSASSGSRSGWNRSRSEIPRSAALRRVRTRLRVSEDWMRFAVAAIRRPRLAESINPRFLLNHEYKGPSELSSAAPATDNRSAFSRISGARARPDERNEGPKPILAAPRSRRKTSAWRPSRKVVRVLFQDVGVVDCKAILPTYVTENQFDGEAGWTLRGPAKEERVAFYPCLRISTAERLDHNVTHVCHGTQQG